jgi:hypothetical protein
MTRLETPVSTVVIMAGRHPGAMRPRDERGHPVVQDAIDKGYVGTGRPYEVNGFESREAANEGRKSINNAARHLGVSCSSREGEHVQELTDGTFRVTFTLWPKAAARAHVHKQAGGDPSNLAYNPFARAQGPVMDDAGRPVGR